VVPQAQKVPTGCDGVSEEACRPLRADALRNRARVLEAAEVVFAAEGVSVPVDVIAEKAGVGVGTLYRHFPTKEKLFEAILIARIIDITADARDRLDSDDPGAAFFGFLEHLVAESARKRDLIMALANSGVAFEDAVGEYKKDLEMAVGDLLHVAQETGAVRADVAPHVVLSLIGATCIASDHPQGAAAPSEMLAIVCDGLRATR
jgi:AcrR family transcriptional regulator